MISGDQSDVRAKMSIDAGFRAFADRVKREDCFSLLNLEKLFAEICDYHGCIIAYFLLYWKYYQPKADPPQAEKRGFRITSLISP